jgi:hypothetical protein
MGGLRVREGGNGAGCDAQGVPPDRDDADADADSEGTHGDQRRDPQRPGLHCGGTPNAELDTCGGSGGSCDALSHSASDGGMVNNQEHTRPQPLANQRSQPLANQRSQSIANQRSQPQPQPLPDTPANHRRRAHGITVPPPSLSLADALGCRGRINQWQQPLQQPLPQPLQQPLPHSAEAWILLDSEAYADLAGDAPGGGWRWLREKRCSDRTLVVHHIVLKKKNQI